MVQVVIVGGGPVGLLLATELASGGIETTVLERLTAVDRTIKAGAINQPTAEILDRRGLWPAVEAAQAESRRRFDEFVRAAMQQRGLDADALKDTPRPRILGHFGGIMLDAVRYDGAHPEAAGRHPGRSGGMVSQQQVEQMLGERAERLGVRVLRGVEFESFDQDADGVTVRCADGSVLRADWLVGCDGGRSRVRKLAGFAFPGTDPEITAYQAVAEMSGHEALEPGWHATPVGVYVHGPMPGRILVARFDGVPVDREAPIGEAELQEAIRHVTGAEVTVHAITSATRFTDNARQVPAYRAGRVLLAGDAAHVHSPFGGQGLNLGLGDAANLGWKLAAVCRGEAGEALLDTYTAERHPIGAWVLDWTRAQIAVMRPDPHARAIRALLTDLAATGDGTTHLVNRISGVWQRYDLGGGHPLVGASAPELAFADGTRLADHLHAGKALLLDPAKALAPAAEGYRSRLIVLHQPVEGDAPAAALLVRPDGYVAWASGAALEAADAAGLTAALSAWLGAPDPAVAAG